MLNQGNNAIRNKLAFYTEQLNKLLGQIGASSTTGIATANRKIICIRLIGLIQSMIQVKSKGGKLCDENKKPSATELDNFFSTYVSPNSPFNISVDSDGNLRISPKEINVVNSKNIDAQPLLAVSKDVKIIKCALSTTKTDIDLVNSWIAELNAVG
jgi:hypothetical protein